MKLIHYRTLPDNVTLPVDQRWRTIELDPETFPNLDLEQPQGIAAAIRRVMDNNVANVAPIPYGAIIYMTDTEKTPHWEISVSIQKAA